MIIISDSTSVITQSILRKLRKTAEDDDWVKILSTAKPTPTPYHIRKLLAKQHYNGRNK